MPYVARPKTDNFLVAADLHRVTYGGCLVCPNSQISPDNGRDRTCDLTMASRRSFLTVVSPAASHHGQWCEYSTVLCPLSSARWIDRCAPRGAIRLTVPRRAERGNCNAQTIDYWRDKYSTITAIYGVAPTEIMAYRPQDLRCAYSMFLM